jgi:hypothetical protein
MWNCPKKDFLFENIIIKNLTIPDDCDRAMCAIDVVETR